MRRTQEERANGAPIRQGREGSRARRAASPSCASIAATTSMRFSQQAMRELRDVPRDFEDDLETSVVILTGSAKAFSAGFDLKDPEGRQRDTLSVGETHPSPAARPQDVQGLAGDGPGHHRRHRGPLHRRRRGAGRVARFPHLREERAFPHPRGRARHEHELGLDPAHAGADGPGAHQAGGDPGVGSHLRRRGAGRGGWSRTWSTMVRRLPAAHGLRRAHRPPAADPRAHDQDARSTASPTRSTISAPTWTPTRTC